MANGALEITGSAERSSQLDLRVKALDTFKDWNNYLLVTTVGALGWASTQVAFTEEHVRWLVIASFTWSVVLGIFTLALVPLVMEALAGSEDGPEPASIFDVQPTMNAMWMWGRVDAPRLKLVCWPQHLLFIFGILAYGYAAATEGITPTP